MSLEALAFLGVYAQLNESTKEQAVIKILETMPLNKILGNEALLDKLKAEIYPKIECPILKFLFMKSNNFGLIFSCYSNPKYFRDLIEHVRCSEWKYIIQMAAGYQLAVKDDQVASFVGNGKTYGVIPFSLDQVDESKLFKLWIEPDGTYFPSNFVRWHEF